MAKHILLTFLSDVKVDKDTNLVCCSQYKGLADTYTTNESAVRYLIKNGWQEQSVSLQRIFAFASLKVSKKEIGAQGNQVEKFYPETSFDEVGNSLTHLQYFKKRISDVVDIKVCMPESEENERENPVCLYNENVNDINETIRTVLTMAEKIENYYDSVSDGEEVILHADMSGGFRHASMMMLAVMRLIQFAGIRIGHILYSNWEAIPKNEKSRFVGRGEVQEIEEIYGMYDLVAGAAEFANFGSVKSFDSYFAPRQKSPGLQNLLAKMKQFDEAITITRRRTFDDAVKELKEALQAFDEECHNKGALKNNTSVETVSDSLIKPLLSRINRDYKELLQAGGDEIVYIKWCLDHDYLQQALALFTEIVPDFIIKEKKLLAPTEECFSKIKAQRAPGDPRNLEYYILSDYTPDTIPVLWLNSDNIQELGKQLKDFFQIIATIIKFQNQILRIWRTENRLEQNNITTYQQEINRQKEQLSELLVSVRKILGGEFVKNDGSPIKREKKIYNPDRQQIENALTGLYELFFDDRGKNIKKADDVLLSSVKGLLNLDSVFESERGKIAEYSKLTKEMISLSADKAISKILKRGKFAWKSKYKRCSKIEMAIYCGDVKTNSVKPEDLLPLLDSYYMIRAIRNDSVHAKKSNRDVRNYTTNEIKEILQNALADIYNIQAL